MDMSLQRVEGEDNLKTLICQLEKDDPGYFFMIELLKVTIHFNYPGVWEFYTLVDKTESGNNDGKDKHLPCVGVLCALRESGFGVYGFHSKQNPDMLIAELQQQVNWSERNAFMYVSHDFMPLLHNISDSSGNILEHKGFTYVLDNFQKLPELPEGNTGKDSHGQYEIRKIHEEFASMINENWPHAIEGVTGPVIKEELQYGYGYGLFLDGRIVSWIIARKFASMGILYTLPEFRGRGYASLVVSALSRDISALNMTVYVNIEPDNIASLTFFEKLGFKKGPVVTNCWYVPKE